ncbi:MAG: hypothetical protein ABI402_10015 [Ferruginibacter sp.]
MKQLLIAFFLLLHSICYSQVNTDSLLNELRHSKKYRYDTAIDYLMKKFQRFKSIDGTECYDVCLNKRKKLREYIGLSIAYRQYDKEGRIIKIIGYNLKGAYSYWDFNPIELTTYSGDSTIEDYYNSKYILTGRKTIIKDRSGRITEILWYNENPTLYSRELNIFVDSVNEIVTKYYDGKGAFKPNEFGVSIHLEKFSPVYKEDKIEEYFYDSTMKLVDADHKEIFREDQSTLKYSQIKKEAKDEYPGTFYYNSKGELICRDFSSGEILILK